MNGSVRLVGLGLTPRDHATVEVLQALGDADLVMAQGFSAGDLAFLRKVCRAGALKTAPAGGDEKAAAALVAAAKKGKAAALATPIHPFYFGLAGSAAVAACEKAGVAWRSFGAVSPMGVAIAVAGVTLGSNVYGLQSFEAEAFATKAVTANPVWPLVLYFTSKPSAKTLSALAASLSALYAPEREGLWCSGKLAGKSGTLGKALAQAKAAGVGDTLYLSASRETKEKLGRTGSDSFSGRGASAPASVEEVD
jgi:hypothetical protein